MAEQKLAMSLDDLIAQAGKQRPGKKPLAKTPAKKPGGGGGVRVGQAAKLKAPLAGARKGLQKNRPAGGAGGQQQQKQQAPKRLSQMPALPQGGGQPRAQQQRQQAPQRASGAANLSVRRGAVQKRQAAPPPARVRQEQHPVQRREALEGNGRWSHDMYDDRHPRPARMAAGPSSTAAATTSKLIISNLHYGVSKDDILDLFSSCGTVTQHNLNYDDSGRSLGTGYVVFDTRAEAEAAKKQFNGVTLDGNEMVLTFAGAVDGDRLSRLSGGILARLGPQPGSRPGIASRLGNTGAGAGRPAQRPPPQQSAPPSRGARPVARGGGRLRSAVVSRGYDAMED